MMRKWMFLPALLLLLPLSGCLVFNQKLLYEKKDLVIDPDLSGVWSEGQVGSKNTDSFQRQIDNTYHITSVGGDGKSAEFTGGVIKLNNRCFLNVTPLAGQGSDVFPKGSSLIFRLTVKDKGKWVLEFLKDDWLRGQLTQGKLKVAHLDFSAKETQDLTLTASTKDLQKFVAAVANKDEAFDDKDALVLVRSN